MSNTCIAYFSGGKSEDCKDFRTMPALSFVLNRTDLKGFTSLKRYRFLDILDTKQNIFQIEIIYCATIMGTVFLV